MIGCFAVPSLMSRTADSRDSLFSQLLSSSGPMSIAAWLLLLFGTASYAEDAAAPVETVSYQKEVLPIFRAHCVGCHQPAKAQGGLVMTDFAKLLAGGESGEAAIVAGNIEASHLLAEIVPVDGKAEMPKNAPPLTDAQIDLIRRWIAQGAVNDLVERPAPFDAEHPPVYRQAPAIPSIDFSPDGQWMAVAGYYEALLFQVSDGSLKGRLVGVSPRVESVRFSPDGTRLAVAAGSPGLSGEIQVWDWQAGQLTLSQSAGFDTPFGLSWSGDGKLLAYGSTDNVVRAIDAATGQRVLYQGAHEDWPRATVFTVSGEHLISAGRDMTVKLTEVATERFIDNVTSITPGALRGGISALARHPLRDEVLVGGSDGSPKLYRVFRQTARQIGDDANLLRKLPEMPGRIFSVAISPDAKYLAAASTLDGRSQVRVWSYDIEGQLPEEIKAIQAKRVMARSAAEKTKLDQYVTTEPQPIGTWEVPAAVYAIAVDNQGRLAAGATDGHLRLWEIASQKPLADFSVVPAPSGAQAATEDHFAADYRKHLDALPGEPLVPLATPPRSIDPATLTKISVLPEKIDLLAWHHSAQLIVLGETASGESIDVTHLATYPAENPLVRVSPLGVVRPIGDGDGALELKVGSLAATVPLHVEASSISPVDFVRDVNPVLSRLGCNQGTCHGAQAGKNGFKLSLRGYDPLYDVRALTDDLAARRVNLSSPHESLMLSKPLGTVPHAGGTLIQQGDPAASVIEQWIRQGAPLKLDTPRVVKLEVQPANPIAQLEGDLRQMRVIATYADGKQRDVTQEAFLESGNSEVAILAGRGRVQAVRRGEAPLLARFEGAYAATTLTVMGNREGFVWQEPPAWNAIDQFVAAKWQRIKTLPSNVCNDAEFIRRVYLDLVGLPPTAEQVRAFLYDPRSTQEKRRVLIEQLLVSDEYVDHWTNKWSDLLQVNSKFLGKEGAQGFKDWIRGQIAANTPYDKFVQSIVTASGSNRQNPPASYYKILRTPEEILENTSHLFLAVRFNCNKCHDHPFEKWTQDQYYQTAAYFAQVGLKKDPESGDKAIGGTAVEGAKPLWEEVFDKPDGEMTHQRTSAVAPPQFPYPVAVEATEPTPRRTQFATWLTSPTNPYFARSYVNRLWGYLLGTGLIEPLDDIRAGNPPSNPELLAYLEKEFIDHKFDVKHVLRLICNSRTYQLSLESNDWNKDDGLNYSKAKARRLPAEVLYDAVHRVTGTRSEIPGLAAGARAASLADADAQLPDGFLNNLGRPVRESACECERSNDLQLGGVMALVSGPTIGSAIGAPQNDLHQLAQSTEDPKAMIAELFLRVLNRPATDAEIAIAEKTIERVQSDHQQLVQALTEKEAWWVEEKAKREQERLKNLETAQQEAAARTEEIKPERERLEKERTDRIAAAEAAKKQYLDQLSESFHQYLTTKAAPTSWIPLAATQLSTTQGGKLIPQADRSIRAEGSQEKGIYQVTAQPGVSRITGVRLEALPVPEIPGGGPGLPPNGNFVVTELEVVAGPISDPKQRTPLKFAKGLTDFDQPGFSAGALIDGKNNDQGGWAVAETGSVEHWAVLQLDKPLDLPADWVLEFKLHQVHEAKDHRLARFRLSVTGAEGDLPLGLPETLSALARLSKEDRAGAALEGGLAYFRKVDPGIREKDAAIGAASAPVPPDEPLVAINKRIERLQQPIGDDSALLRLRSDVEQSAIQVKQARVTVAEDLTWALINSPAFLFNH